MPDPGVALWYAMAREQLGHARSWLAAVRECNAPGCRGCVECLDAAVACLVRAQVDREEARKLRRARHATSTSTLPSSSA